MATYISFLLSHCGNTEQTENLPSEPHFSPHPSGCPVVTLISHRHQQRHPHHSFHLAKLALRPHGTPPHTVAPAIHTLSLWMPPPEATQHLSFCIWLISLSTMALRFSHTVAGVRIPPPFSGLNTIPRCVQMHQVHPCTHESTPLLPRSASVNLWLWAWVQPLPFHISAGSPDMSTASPKHSNKKTTNTNLGFMALFRRSQLAPVCSAFIPLHVSFKEEEWSPVLWSRAGLQRC